VQTPEIIECVSACVLNRGAGLILIRLQAVGAIRTVQAPGLGLAAAHAGLALAPNLILTGEASNLVAEIASACFRSLLNDCQLGFGLPRVRPGKSMRQIHLPIDLDTSQGPSARSFNNRTPREIISEL
jgi:hypothetical protein